MKNKTVACQVIAGNPATYQYFIQNYVNRLDNLIDTLYIQLDTISNSIVGHFPETKNFFYDLIKEKNFFIIENSISPNEFVYENISYDPEPWMEQTWTGGCMRQAIDSSVEDVMFFTHDDCFITDESIFKKHLDYVKYKIKDMVFSSSKCLSPSLFPYILKKYPFLDRNGANLHYGLTTSYFIVNREDLLNTKLNFDGQVYKNGNTIYGLDLIVDKKLESENVFLEQGMDVLFQLYKNGKTNPYIPLYEESAFISYLEEIEKYYVEKEKNGHVHLTAGGVAKNMFSISPKEFIESSWNMNNETFYEDHFYIKIRQLEKILCANLSFLYYIDYYKYPYMKRFKKEFIDRMHELTCYANEILKHIDYDTEHFTNKNYISNFNNEYIKKPYKIDLFNLPVEKFRKLYD